jgi:N-acetylglucosamine-6-phosphate deacetylase
MSAELEPVPPPLAIVGGRLATPSGLEPAELQLVDGRVRSVEPPGSSAGTGGPQRLDADGLIVAAGLVDIQINGGHGIDLWSEPHRLWELARLLPRHGVTAFCPTIVSGPPERVDEALRALTDGPDTGTDTPYGHGVGAEPLGLHLEGPMLAPQRRGAHDRRHLVAPSPSVVEGWSVERGVALVTLAPELEGADEVIVALRRAGVTVSAGHTDATAEQAARAEGAGVTLVTHLFNAMAPLHHRHPGLVGHVLGSDRLRAGLIVDGIHVSPGVVALALRALGTDRLVLVSDAVAAMGLGPGRHRFGDRTVTADHTGVRHPDGTLAGSDLTLDRAVRNLVAFTGASLHDALRCASDTPARALGPLADGRGRLVPGSVADVVLLDQDLEVQATVCRGRIAHLADGAEARLRPA